MCRSVCGIVYSPKLVGESCRRAVEQRLHSNQTPQEHGITTWHHNLTMLLLAGGNISKPPPFPQCRRLLGRYLRAHTSPKQDRKVCDVSLICKQLHLRCWSKYHDSCTKTVATPFLHTQCGPSQTGPNMHAVLQH